MKKVLMICSLCFALTACKKTVNITDTVTVNQTVDLKRGLTAYYQFSGNANDSSGNSKHGTLINGTSFTTDSKNKTASAANFDGINDYINVTDATNYFPSSKMSISFQINFRNTSVRSAILSKTAFATPSSVSWGVDLTNRLSFTSPDLNQNCGTWIDNPSYHLYSTNTFQTNSWYHITIIYNQGVELMYINGALNSAKISNSSSLNQCTAANL